MAAGLGFKTFTTGEVLTAADTNGYLMQGVLVFASAAARDAAITSPQEGQCCYLKDTDAVLTYSGAAWVGFDDSNAIQNAIVDAKGDLIAASAADTPARLAVGNNGEQLLADSAATTGLRYSATPSASNPILNSAFQVFQRGTTTTLTSTSFVADRWQAIRSVAGATATRQVTGDTTNLPFIQYCLRVARDSGNTSTSVIALGQNMESVNSIPFAGKAISYSFYARAGANFSQASGALNVYLTSGTGTDQNNVTGSFTGATQVVNSTATLTTTWQRFTYTGTVAATATQLSPQFQFTPVGTAGANDYYEITGVQIDIGSVALPFRTYAATIQGELAACQRYYYLYKSGNSLALTNMAYFATGTIIGVITFLVQMRVTPSLVIATGTNYYCVETLAGQDLFNSLTIDRASPTSAGVFNNTDVSGTLGMSAYCYTTNASASIAFSAEL